MSGIQGLIYTLGVAVSTVLAVIVLVCLVVAGFRKDDT